MIPEGNIVANRYDVRRRIGRGGSSTVYRVFDRVREAEVALKVLNAGLDEPACARFQNEFLQLSRLRHRRVVSVHSTGVFEGHPYFTMDLVEGNTLAEALMDPERAEWLRTHHFGRVAVQVAEGLRYIHGKQVVHRDLKPSNIMVRFGPRGGVQCVLVDFGLVKSLAADASLVTGGGVVLGTAPYLSPEQAGGKQIDARSDLYSFGVILYELLAGRPPFTSRSAVPILLKHVNEPPPPLRSTCPHISSALEGVVMRLLQKHPADRYPSATAFLKAFRQTVPRTATRFAPGTLPLPRGAPHDTGFVGREDELRRACNALETARGGRRQVLLLTGPAGVGKTRLAEEVFSEAALRRSGASGMKLVRTACAEEGVGFSPWLAAMDGLATSGGGEETPAPPAPLRPYVSDGSRRLRRSLRKLIDTASAVPVAVLIDAVEHADEVTRQAVETLARLEQPLPILLCLTCRTPAAGDVPAWLQALRGGEDFVELALPNLEPAQVSALAASVLGAGDIGADLRERLFERCGGNTLLLLEDVQDLLDRRLLKVSDTGRWTLVEDAEEVGPGRTRDLVRARLDALEPEQRLLLEVVSIFPGQVPLRLVEAIWDGDAPAFRRVSKHLLDVRLLRRVRGSGDAPAFTSSIYRTAVYGALALERKQELHRRAAHAIERLPDPDAGRTYEIAYHFARSDQRKEAVKALAAAGKVALTRGDYGVSVRLLEELLETPLADELPERGAHRLDCLNDYVEARLQSGRLPGCTELIEKGRGWSAGAVADQQARFAWLQGEVVCASGEDAEAGLTSLRESLRLYQEAGDVDRQAFLLSRLASYCDVLGRQEQSAEYLRQASAIAAGAGEDASDALSIFLKAREFLTRYEYGHAGPLLDEALRGFRRLHSPDLVDICLYWRARTAFYEGAFRAAQAMLAELLDSATRHGSIRIQGECLAWMAESALESGDPGAAIEYASDACDRLRAVGDAYYVHRASAALAVGLALLGRVDEAVKRVEALREYLAGPHPVWTGNLPVVWAGAARVYALSGDPENARTCYGEAVACREDRKGGEWLRALIDAGEYKAAGGETSEAGRLLDRAAAYAEQCGATYFRQKAERLAAGVEREAVPAARPSAGGLQPDHDRLMSLYETCRDLVGFKDLNALLDRILSRAVHLTGAERGVIALFDPGDLAHPQILRSHKMDSDEELHVSMSALRHVMESGEVLFSTDACSDDIAGDFESVYDFGIRSLLVLPLRYPGPGLSGALYVDHRGLGAFDLADRAFLEAFSSLLASVLSRAQLHREAGRIATARRGQETAPREQLGPLHGISPPMQAVYTLIEAFAGAGITVLITGETGTGKELAARAIHDLGTRRDQPFVAQNCGALPAELLQSELFGHRKGAFTGALWDRPGLFETADGGTVFLDEIADASQALQTSLLRVLEEGEVRRVGEDQVRKVDVRVIAATNRDLRKCVEEGSLRPDLYFRLAGAELTMPPLRQRPEDVPLLAEVFLKETAAKAKKQIPGLRMGSFEKQVLEDALRRFGGNVTRSAAFLEISRQTLYEKLESHGLDPDRYRAG